jgi:hypothetical protein
MMHVDIRGQVGFLVEQISARTQHLEAIAYFCAKEIGSMDDEKARLESQLEQLEEADKFCKTWKSDLAQRKADMSGLRDAVSKKRSQLPAAIVDRIGFPGAGSGGGVYPNTFPTSYRQFGNPPDMSTFGYGQAQFAANPQFPSGQYPSPFLQNQYTASHYPVASFLGPRGSEFPRGRRNVSDPPALTKAKVSRPTTPGVPEASNPFGEHQRDDSRADTADKVENGNTEASHPKESDHEDAESSDDDLLSNEKIRRRANQGDESGGPRNPEENPEVELLE